MKKLILILMVGGLFTGCAPVTQKMLQPDNNPIPNKIKSLNIGIEGSDVIRYNTNITDYQTRFNTIFKRAIEQNICQQSIDKWGYIDFNITFSSFWTKWYTLPITLSSYLFSMGLYPILGGDSFFHRHIFEAEISIYNSKNMLIKQYILSDEIHSTSGLINWKRNKPNILTAKYLSDIKVMNSIMDKLSVEISKVAWYINSELEKAGQIN